MKILNELLAAIRPSRAAWKPGVGKGVDRGQQAEAGAPDGDPSQSAERAAVMAALEKLAAERTALREAQAAAHDKRQALLLEDDNDAQVDAVEREMDRATRRLEMLDEVEPQLLERSQQLAEAARRGDFGMLCKADLSLVPELIKALMQLDGIQQGRKAIRRLADERGFASEVQLKFFPSLSLPIRFAELAANLQAELRRYEQADAVKPDARPAGLILRFVQRFPPYHVGEVMAAPDAFTAWAYIRKGVAVWEYDDQVPAAPPMGSHQTNPEDRKPRSVTFTRDGFAIEGEKPFRAGATVLLPEWFAAAAVNGGFARNAVGAATAALADESSRAEGES